MSRRLPPLKDILRLDEQLSAEELHLATQLRTLLLLQEFPDIGIVALSGTIVPPHERTMLYQLNWGAGNNVVVGSRGTAKSSTALVLYPTYKALVTPRRTFVELSAKGFRQGQMMFLDAERWIKGGWDSQKLPAEFFKASINRPQILNKSANYWTLEFDSFSKITTLPTKDHDSIRGIRGHELFIDEANLAEKDLIDKVALPFLNVKGDFEHGGAFSNTNQVVFTSTVDYNWRPFVDRIAVARAGLERDFAAAQAIKDKDVERYEDLDSQGLLEHTLYRVDYTDLLIRQKVLNREGKEYELKWPNAKIPLQYDNKGIPFIEKDEKGNIKKNGSPLYYWSTYPLDKAFLERPLLDGSIDEGGWLAEQRNIVDTAMGDVYSHDLIDRVSCKGDRSIIPFGLLPPEWRKQHEEGEIDYVPPVLWRCTDPCVLGVDYAPQSDFCAFVVIRLGPLAVGGFDPFTHCGRTTWSNVIWAEQHRGMSGKQAADKIRELLERYNIVWFDDHHIDDPWESCRGVGIDMRGGGNSIRDELIYINDEAVPVGAYRIYDRFDKDERIGRFVQDTNARPMLDAIWPTDQLNDKLVEFSLGQMQQGFLYIPKYFDINSRPKNQRELAIAFNAALSLDGQLRKLRQRPTKNWRNFYMEGDTDKDKNKKDLWSALLYAVKQMRAHIIRQRQIDNTPPPMGGKITIVNRGGSHGKGAGARQEDRPGRGYRR